MKKIINFCYNKKIRLVELLIIMYKKSRRFYGQHANKLAVFPKLSSIIKGIFSVFGLKIVFYDPDKEKQLEKLLDKMTVSYDGKTRFYYWIDEKIYFSNRYNVIGNMPVDYSIVVNNSITDIKNSLGSVNSNKYIDLLNAVERYIDRICKELTVVHGDKVEKIVNNLQSMKTLKAHDVEDALQRILFWNALLHQTGQTLVGLGRLDYILDNFTVEDEKATREVLRDFCVAVHSNYHYKSQALVGDTGQIIVLGGCDENGSSFVNDYTYMFLDIVEQLGLPDPKLMMRVDKNTPRELIEKSVKCVMTGNGSPLFANDCVIIPLLENYGYEKADVYNYAVSACWEPVIIGKSMDQNNLCTISFAKAFCDALKKSIDSTVNDINDFLIIYEDYLVQDIEEQTSKLYWYPWEESPLISIFFDECVRSGLDISKGGSKYNNYGLLTDGLSNAVNSLLNIERLVFEDGKYTLQQVHKVLKKDYKGSELLLSELNSTDEYFGQDSEKVISLSNRLFRICKEAIKGKKNCLGGGFKIGLSSPGYLIDGYQTPATFDGRHKNTALSTHISCDRNIAYTELVSFASQIDYSENGFNGNVIDFMVTPDFINSNKEKFSDFVILSIERGFFEMQMNVVSSDILIDAKNNPNNYRGLIVRVWGFSAYYIDLPEEYQDMLIERALKSEGKAA